MAREASDTEAQWASTAYRAVWGNGQRPYSFQQRVTELLAQGKRVILQAPTGAGKTRAALTAFFYGHLQQPLPGMPPRCLYAVPMRVLATQFHMDHADMLRAPAAVTIQTGEAQCDRRLQGSLVFLTIDQLLSSFLTTPYSLSVRQANLNAGAVVGAYLVLDEFHLLDPGSTLPTTLDVLARLDGLGPVLLMTATFSTNMLSELASMLRAEVVTTSPDEVALIESRWGRCSPRQRTWRVAPEAISADAVLAAHRSRTLVVCNQVGQAQRLYDELSAKRDQVILLHSRFLPEDRRRWEDDLRRAFGEGSEADIIAVATQVVEVGLDISADTLHTELAPSAAMIQRAGRCARYPGESGVVWIYPTENPRPYAHKADHPLATEMAQALEWLRGRDGQVFGFGEEQALVDAVTAERDRRTLEGLRAGLASHAQRVDQVLDGNLAVREATTLVRDAASRTLVIHDHPECLLPRPYAASSFALHPSVLLGAFKGWRERAAELELGWAARRLMDAGDEEESNRSHYRWVEVADAKELLGAGLVAAHPALVGYDPRRGLLLQEGSGFSSSLPEGEARADERMLRSYQVEPYALHVQRLLGALEAGVLAAFLPAAEALEREAGWRPGTLSKALRLACALHDAGKLTQGWQGWAQAYQQAIGEPITGPVAHTHYDEQSQGHREAQRAAKRRPSHAVEGAMAVLPVLLGALEGEEPLVRAAVSAIARHHGPFARGYRPFAMGPWAVSEVEASLAQLPADVRGGADARELMLRGDPDQPGFRFDVLARPSRHHEWLAYALLVRALRLADQAGTAAATDDGGSEA